MSYRWYTSPSHLIRRVPNAVEYLRLRNPFNNPNYNPDFPIEHYDVDYWPRHFRFNADYSDYLYGAARMVAPYVPAAGVAAGSYLLYATRPRASVESGRIVDTSVRESPYFPRTHMRRDQQDPISEIPLKRTFGPHDVPEHGKYMARMPTSMDVTLKTVYTTGPGAGWNDGGTYRYSVQRICCNMLYNFSDWSPPSGIAPMYMHEALQWFGLYKKVHVYGFSIDVELQHWHQSTTGDGLFYVGVVSDGAVDSWSETPGNLTSLTDFSDWQSQRYAQSNFDWQSNTVLGPTPRHRFHWDIDCERDFGSDVARDERLDQPYTGVPATSMPSKFYNFHMACFDYFDNQVSVPTIKYEIVQRCVFYQPVSNVHA